MVNEEIITNAFIEHMAGIAKYDKDGSIIGHDIESNWIVNINFPDNSPNHTIIDYKKNGIIEETKITGPEIWKEIPGWEGYYEVSSHGRIKSLSRKMFGVDFQGKRIEKNLSEKILKPIKAKCRGGDYYLRVRLFRNNAYTQTQIHRLVALTFIPNPLNLKHPNHKNGLKYMNNIENLEWTNHSENAKHAYRIGLNKGIKGETVATSILKEKDVLEIRNLYDSGDYTMREIGKLFNTDATNISLIVNRRSWRHI